MTGLNDCDVVAKCITLGASGSGKSSLIIRLSEDTFFQDITSTIAVDFRCAFIVTRGLRVRLSVFDSAGQERFSQICSSFIRGANGVIICFDVTNRTTFDDLDKWLERCKMHSIPGTPVMLVGCKCDEDGKRKVRREEAEGWARANGNIPYIETSAKSNVNVQEAFRIAADLIIDRMNAGVPIQPAQTANSVRLVQPPPRPGAGGPGATRGGASAGGGGGAGECGC